MGNEYVVVNCKWYYGIIVCIFILLKLNNMYVIKSYKFREFKICILIL